MKKIELKKYPDPCLRVKTNFCSGKDPDIPELLSRMADIMYESGGVGLAGPQVGVGIRVFVMDPGCGLAGFVDPRIVESSDNKTSLEEGCLSLPGATVNVSRPEKVKIRAYDSEGNMFTKSYSVLEAKIVQHEIDHLEGKLITDHVHALKRFFILRKVKATPLIVPGDKCEVVCRAGKKD